MLDLTPLGTAVRAVRLERGLTIRGLSEKSGVSARFVSDLERGHGNISVRRLAAVADALSCSMADLVSALDNPVQSRAAVALVGLRGAGKSTIGQRVADELRVPFVELDADVERTAGLPLAQLFEMHGEAYYRRLEAEVLGARLDAGQRIILATGGGLVTNDSTWDRLKSEARTVWLQAKPEQHYRRVMRQGDLRPMKNRPSAMMELETLLDRRAPLYAEADATIDTSALGLAKSVRALRDLAAHHWRI